MTLIAASRDVLRVIRAEQGPKAEDLRPALDETELLFGKIDGLCHDEWRGYAPLVYENERTVVHTEEYVTEDGVHTNQVECLWSLIEPWLEKFRGLSKPGLEQSVRTRRFVWTLNLIGASLYGLVDCFALNVFHQTR